MPRSHTIASGENLTRISKQYGIPIPDLLKYNPQIKDPNRIFAGATLNLPDLAPGPTPAPAAGPTPAPDPFQSRATTAGAAGLSPNDTATLFGATPEEEKATKDQLAQTFGYGSFDDFAKEVFTKPSKTTEQFYRDAYAAAGLDQLLSKITDRKNQLAQAEGAINDNPWLSEASRVGRARRLQELAGADIETWQEAYNLGLSKVRDLVSSNAADIGADERRREAQFNYLLKTAESETSKKGAQRLSTYLPQYLAGRNSTQEPKIVELSEGQSAYRWNPTSQNFELIASKAKTYAPPRTSTAKKSTSTGASASPGSEKIITAFRKALASRTALDRAKTREQFIRELQSQFKDIDPGDIARAVYETYPDGFDGY